MNKGKEYTFKNFKKFGIHKATIYRWMKKIEENGNCDRKKGSGGGNRKVSNAMKKKIKKMVNNKVGVSQRKIGNSLKVDYTTVGRTIKKIGLKYRKRCRAPKATEAQKGRQVERLEKLCQGPMSWADDRDIVMDDESYLTLTGAGMPGNMGFYTNDIESCPEDVKFRYDEKFPGKVMVHCSISKKGFSQLYVAPRTTTMDGTLYTAYRGWSIQKKFLHPKTKNRV